MRLNGTSIIGLCINVSGRIGQFVTSKVCCALTRTKICWSQNLPCRPFFLWVLLGALFSSLEMNNSNSSKRQPCILKHHTESLFSRHYVVRLSGTRQQNEDLNGNQTFTWLAYLILIRCIFLQRHFSQSVHGDNSNIEWKHQPSECIWWRHSECQFVSEWSLQVQCMHTTFDASWV